MARPDKQVAPAYLAPYVEAARRHGGGFRSLLWASAATQRQRFEVIDSLYDASGRSVLDVGCGRGDYLRFLLALGVRPAEYLGIEAVPALAAEAARCAPEPGDPRVTIIQADFLREPKRLFVGADVTVISGSLNTVPDADFYTTISRAFEASTEALVFNFLDSPVLAGREYLHWRSPNDVLAFAKGLTSDVRMENTYMEGDGTMVLRRSSVGRGR